MNAPRTERFEYKCELERSGRAHVFPALRLDGLYSDIVYDVEANSPVNLVVEGRVHADGKWRVIGQGDGYGRLRIGPLDAVRFSVDSGRKTPVRILGTIR